MPKITVTILRDNGLKERFVFEPEPPDIREDEAGRWVRWGSYEANYWFGAGFGKSWRTAMAYAVRRLRRLSRHKLEAVETSV